MVTEFQRLTTPRTWGPEAVQDHSAWNVEGHHVTSQAGGAAAREDSGSLLDRGPIDLCVLGSQRLILTGTLPCALNSALRGDHCPAVGLEPGPTRDLTLTLTPTPTPPSRTLHQKLSLPRR